MDNIKATEYLLQHVPELPSLGIGTSRLAHYFSKEQAVRDLETAFDHGICYFDTAPIYGFGWSEKILGLFANGKRNKIVLATKAGLEASSRLTALPLQVQYLLRKSASTWNGFFQGEEKNNRSVGITQPALSEAQLMSSLDQSLKRLKTDYVDFLLLHEATVERANSSEALSFADKALQSGKARFVGVGSSLANLAGQEDLNPVYTMIQHECDFSEPASFAVNNRIVNIHGIHRLAHKIITLTERPQFKREIFQKTEIDLSVHETIYAVSFAIAAREAVNGMVLIASSQQKHLLENISTWKQNKHSSLPLETIIEVMNSYTSVQ